ncbi:MAG: Tol-Pal system protein TolB [Alphaproteobacteria bacterium]|jgi:TolB protein|nr:Tol-Pal system protein TolB [Alphaproteobacteria bacterium]MBT5390567.1 Tol-Pal system protein TolB [Alphaproteobacteria bacterium]MBT5540926.1 Tol-Pal system protein TolB [Alphaproteobacteria bacterium]MBT5654344.1 Tol-Pal system protein TolB [Alphaproteobacteria bacterium]
MIRKLFQILIFVGLLLGQGELLVSPAKAELIVEVTQGNVDPLPIAIPNFQEDSNWKGMGKEISKIVSDDMENSGLFHAIDHRSFIEDPQKIKEMPRFPDWRLIKAQALVTGRVIGMGPGKMRVEFRLWDVFSQRQIEGIAYTSSKDGWRRIAHRISDAIYKRLTGEDGYFDTQLVYVSETAPNKKKNTRRLAIMDQDGANHQFLTPGDHLTLTPRFSTTDRLITYMSYAKNTPRVYLMDLNTQQKKLLGDFPGMTFAPRFSPDGKKVIMSQSLKGLSSIYTIDLKTNKVVKLTNSPGIDTSPSYSPDGSKIAFNSDRGGRYHIYVMGSNGRGIQRISKGEGRYATPVWSPRGDLIAFTKIHNKQFYIGVMKPDGSGERLLTSGFIVEGPTWAPNGRVIVYTRQTPSDRRGRGGNSKLYSIDITGRNERIIATPTHGSAPAWSFLNKV